MLWRNIWRRLNNMATLTPGFSFGSTETVTNTKLGLLVSGGSVSGIANADVDAGAAISDTKLDLATIAQAVQFNGAVTGASIHTMSSKIMKWAKGADVASVAGETTLGEDGNYFDITGTNAITSITAKEAGTLVTLQFDSTASLVDASNLKLDGNFTGATGSTIMLVSDGTNWFEVSRQPQTVVTTPPTGSITMWGGAIASPPSGWLICNGSEVRPKATTYAALYAVIGHTYGADPGTDGFVLPNFTNKFPYGANEGASAGNASVGSTGGLTPAANDSSVTLASGVNGGGAFQPDGTSADSCSRDGHTHNTMPPYLAVSFIIKT